MEQFEGQYHTKMFLRFADDFFLYMDEYSPEETHLPFWVWLDQGEYSDALGMGYFLRFQPNKDKEAMYKDAEKFPILMINSLTIWNMPRDSSLTDIDIAHLRKWVKINRKELKLLSQGKLGRLEFERGKSMNRYLEYLFSEMSVSCKPEDTGLCILVRVNVGENSNIPIGLAFSPYRVSAGDRQKGIKSSTLVKMDLDTCKHDALPKDATVTKADIDLLKKWVRKNKATIQKFLDRQVTSSQFLDLISKSKV